MTFVELSSGLGLILSKYLHIKVIVWVKDAQLQASTDDRAKAKKIFKTSSYKIHAKILHKIFAGGWGGENINLV